MGIVPSESLPDWARWRAKVRISEKLEVHFACNAQPGAWDAWIYPAFFRIAPDGKLEALFPFPKTRMEVQKEGRSFWPWPVAFWVCPETGEMILDLEFEQDHPISGSNQRILFAPEDFLPKILESHDGSFADGGSGDPQRLSAIAPRFKQAWVEEFGAKRAQKSRRK